MPTERRLNYRPGSNILIGDQQSLWQDRVILDDDFYTALRDHPVPVSEAALRAIGPRSMVLDIYVWLSYRLHVLMRDVDVGWPGLYSQFGAGYKHIRQFRQHFIEALEMVTAAYPDANVYVGERGITLCPSKPSVQATG